MNGARTLTTIAAAMTAALSMANVWGQCTEATTIHAEIGIDVSTTEAEARAPGYMELLDQNGNLCTYAMTATLTITQDAPNLVFESYVSGASGSLVEIEAPAQVGSCYTSSIDARGEGLRDVHHAGPVCWSGPTECDTCPRDSCETDPTCNTSPLVLRTAPGGYRMTGLEDPVHFDIDADGERESVGWTVRGSGQGFLAVDRNHNGAIDDGSELFGNHTRLPDGRTAANGFDALAPLDSDGNGIVDPRDDSWEHLLVWVDADHDGVSNASELSRLDAHAIGWLSYDYHSTKRRDAAGNLFRYQSEFGLDGTPHPYYDIYLVTAR